MVLSGVMTCVIASLIRLCQLHAWSSAKQSRHLPHSAVASSAAGIGVVKTLNPSTVMPPAMQGFTSNFNQTYLFWCNLSTLAWDDI